MLAGTGGTEPGARAYHHPSPRPDWLALRQEVPLDPGQRILDAHHHLWTRPGAEYLLDDLGADVAASGHHVVGSVFLQCGHGFRPDGPPEFRPVGETEAVVAMLRARPGTALCQGIVGYADLRRDNVAAVLEAHVAAGEGRFRGVRQSTALDPLVLSTLSAVPPPGLMGDPAFRRGFATLGRMGLSYDAWLYHRQLPELLDLLRAHPEVPVVLNHMGGLLLVGSLRERREETMAAWCADLRRVAEHPNVVLKLGGFAREVLGFDFDTWAVPPDSETLAEAWRPIFEPCVEIFGPDRCLFESNFPVDKAMAGYGTLWNAYKRLSAGFSAEERDAMFHGTAARAYRIRGAA